MDYSRKRHRRRQCRCRQCRVGPDCWCKYSCHTRRQRCHRRSPAAAGLLPRGSCRTGHPSHRRLHRERGHNSPRWEEGSAVATYTAVVESGSLSGAEPLPAWLRGATDAASPSTWGWRIPPHGTLPFRYRNKQGKSSESCQGARSRTPCRQKRDRRTCCSCNHEVMVWVSERHSTHRASLGRRAKWALHPSHRRHFHEEPRKCE